MCHDIFFFFFNDTATTEIYTLSLHDALPISLERIDGPTLICLARQALPYLGELDINTRREGALRGGCILDRKSTRLNSSHANISYAVFCLKKKKKQVSYVIHKAVDILALNIR